MCFFRNIMLMEQLPVGKKINRQFTFIQMSLLIYKIYREIQIVNSHTSTFY